MGFLILGRRRRYYIEKNKFKKRNGFRIGHGRHTDDILQWHYNLIEMLRTGKATLKSLVECIVLRLNGL